MDFTRNYVNWINGLTKDQFDIFIKAFIKDHWNIENVVLTDGTGDGGIDIKIFEDKRRKKIPIQVTVEKKVYPKLRKDFVKISKLVNEHDYSDSLFFFFSGGAAESKVDEVVTEAREDHSLNLNFFDNKVLASFLDKPNYSTARDTLRTFLGGFLKEENSYFDKNQKLYFDYLSHGDDSKELKERFLLSFILHELYKNDKDTNDLDIIVKKIEDEFEIKVSKSYCSRLLNNLITSKKIEKNPAGKFDLSENERKNIKKIRDDAEFLERDFSTKLQKLILESNSDIEIRILIKKIKEIFISQNKIDLNEISEDLTNEDSSREISDFYNYVKSCFKYDVKYKKFVDAVFNLCIENNYLVKISAGKLFKDLMDNPEFNAYARRANKEVFIDTPVLIYLLLVMKEPDFNYDNYKFKIAQEFFDLISSNDESACYNSTQLYITELADHFRHSIRLIPIQETGLYDTLGGSDNEILNFYLALKKEGIILTSYKEFLESFGISINKIEQDDRNEYLIQTLIQVFKSNGVQIDDVPPYNTLHHTKKDYDRINRTLAEIYSRNANHRRPRSLKFDALLFCHLNFLEDLVDPTVITWDKTFHDFRKEFLPRNPNFEYWHLFTPGKFLDHISLLKFKINGGAISKEILSMIETDFEVVKSVRRIADVLTSIVDLKTARGFNLTKGFAEIRETYIFQINQQKEEKVFYEETLPVDNVVIDIVEYYQKAKGEFNYDDFLDSLKNDQGIENLLSIVNEEKEHYLKFKEFTNNYTSLFDKVIKDIKAS